MKNLFIILLFCPLFIFSQNSEKIKIVRVTKTTQFGKILKKNDFLKIEKAPLPIEINSDFFVKNKIIMQKGAELILLYKDNNRIITYNDYINKKISMKLINANCSTRGELETFTCNDSVSDSKFHLMSMLNVEKKIYGIECLKSYFNSEVYWLNENDILLFDKNNNFIDSLIFENTNYRILFKNQNNAIEINSNSFPADEIFKIFYVKENEKIFISDARVINAPKIILKSKEQKYSKDETIKLLINYYLYDNFLEDGINKQIAIELYKTVSNYYK